MRFRNRIDAGRQLAQRLSHYTGRTDVVVLALPRGGVPVAAEVAAQLRVPFDVFLVRKLGVPGHHELAMGAIAEGGVAVLSEDLIRSLGIPDAHVEQVKVRERLELDRRDRLYRGARKTPFLRDRAVILIDDGLATGSTMEAAITALRSLSPARIVVATPVGAPDSCARIGRLADELVCVEMPEHFSAVGQWYDDFSETSDDEVRELLARPQHGAASQPVATRTAVRVSVDHGSLDGDLTLPPHPIGVVLFAHGSGSSRHSPRNQYVARALEAQGLATLLIDLLTAAEEAIDRRTAHLRFDIPLLASRLVAIVDWLHTDSEAQSLPIGLFGASTGGGAALVAAAQRPFEVSAVVSRGGRPDLAGAALPLVTAPTLLIVGERDEPVIALNQEAMARMRGEVTLEIVHGATHLFEEPGTLEKVAALAGAWFAARLREQAHAG